MIRKLSLAMAIAAALSPIDAYALGVGEIHLKSALNQVLDADIDLLSVAEGELPDVKVKLASPEAFSKAGLDRPHSLTELRFEAIRKKDGNAAIKVTSTGPIREPFLNFLIEINWSQGKLQREFTLLLDPPTSLQRKPPVVEPAKVKAPPAPVKRPAPVQAPALTEPAPKPEAKPKAAPAPVTGGNYTVKRNDSVWKIAERQRPAGVSMEEMMVAIYRANPEAFYGGSINNLKSGAILRLPSREDLGNLSPAQARNEYLAQVSAWQSTTYSETLVGKTPPVAKPQGEAATPAQTAPVTPAPSSEKAAPDQGDRLEILAAKPEGKGPAGDEAGKAQVENLKKDLLLAREATESARLESGELKSRVKDLEGQVSGLERLIKLKNDQLAQLQELTKEKEKEIQQLATEKAAAEKAAEEARSAQQTPTTQKAEETPAIQPPLTEAVKETAPEEPAPEKTEQEKMAEAMAKLSGDVQRKPAPPLEEAATPAVSEAEKRPDEPAEPAVEKPVEAPGSLVGETGKEPAEVPAEPAPQPVEKPEPPKEVKRPAETRVEPSGVKATPAQEPVIAEPVPIEPEKPAQEPAAETERPPVEGTEGQKPVAPPAQEETQPAPQPQPQQETPSQAPVEQPAVEEGIFDQLLASPLVLAGGGIALALLILLMMKGRGQKRPLRGEEAIPDIPVSELTDDDSIPVSFEDSHPAGRGRGQLREMDEDTSSSFLTDFTPSELEQLGDETADVDPASEADVYMAYGRYQQAQELMREAVEREPDRADLKLKYLEVLHASNAKTSFMDMANRYAKEGLRERDPNGWNRIAKLGREFAPNDKLFTEVAVATAAASAVAAAPAAKSAPKPTPKEDDFGDFDLSAEDLEDSELSLMNLEKELLAEKSAAPARLEKASESPLADLALDSSKQVQPGPTEFSELDFEGLDFGEGLDEEPLGDISAELTGLAPSPAKAEPKGAEPKKEDTGFDFNLEDFDFSDLGKPETTPSGPSIFDTAPPLTKIKEEDLQHIDIGDLNLELDASEITPEELHAIPEPEAESFDLSTEGLDLNHLEDLSELRTEPVDQESFGLYGLSDLPPTEQIDEIQTKLELAHAYQEMGDSEGARSILEEVLEEGNQAQKAAAKKLMEGL